MPVQPKPRAKSASTGAKSTTKKSPSTSSKPSSSKAPTSKTGTNKTGTSKTASGKTAGSKKSAGATGSEDTTGQSILSYELKLLTLLIVFAFSLLSLHTDSAGVIGKSLKLILTGLFSMGAFFMPYIVFTIVFMGINRNMTKHRIRIQLATGALFFALVLFVGLNSLQFTVLNFYTKEGLITAYEQGQQLMGNGAIGNFIFGMFYKPLGQFGTVLLMTGLIMLFLTLAVHLTPSKMLQMIGFTAVKTKDSIIKTNQNVNEAVKNGIEQLNTHYDQTEETRQKHKRHILDLMNKDLFPSEQKPTIKEVQLSTDDIEVSYQPDYSRPRLQDHQDAAADVAITPPLIGTMTGDATGYITIDGVPEPKLNPHDDSEFDIVSDVDVDPDFDLSAEFDADSIDELDLESEGNLENDIRILDFQQISRKKIKDSLKPVGAPVIEAVDETIPIVALTDEENLGVLQDVTDGNVMVAQSKTIEIAEEVSPVDVVQEVFNYEHYVLPNLEQLKEGVPQNSERDRKEILMKARLLEDTLSNFKIEAKVVQVSKGPMITRFEIQPSPGVKVSRIVNLADDIALNLAATTIRIVAPIPGKAAVGIEVPNRTTTIVTLRDVIESETYEQLSSPIRFGLGKEISGLPCVADLAKMPHLLIAGSTGSGKSVCVNTIISSILFNAKPDEVKFLMIDPKVVELNVYNGIPHLILPVVTDPKKASIALNWAVQEMTDRYNKFADCGVRDITSYNKKYELTGEGQHMPRIVVIIDELADLMMVAPNQVEDAICRLAQMARAAGIHLIVATQRPSVDVITGVIKANIPSRIAFAVSSQIDSRTIIDMAGAEKLLGKGDMLYFPVGESKPKRVQGSFISEEEVEALVTYVKAQVGGKLLYDHSVLEDVKYSQFAEADEPIDDLLEDAIRFVIETEKASTSLLQRRFRVGYNRAARLVDELEARGVVGPSRGSKPREVTMTWTEYQNLGE